MKLTILALLATAALTTACDDSGSWQGACCQQAQQRREACVRDCNSAFDTGPQREKCAALCNDDFGGACKKGRSVAERHAEKRCDSYNAAECRSRCLFGDLPRDECLAACDAQYPC